MRHVCEIDETASNDGGLLHPADSGYAGRSSAGTGVISGRFPIHHDYGNRELVQFATSSQSSPTEAPAVALQTADQLDSLVAPIALYPDALVAQVLAAAALPEQVAYAEDWLQQNSNLTGSALVQAVNQQSWDPSVKALTQFPSVLNDLAKNLSWTSSLGQAYVNQQSDVMAAVQTMRAQAQASRHAAVFVPDHGGSAESVDHCDQAGEP